MKLFLQSAHFFVINGSTFWFWSLSKGNDWGITALNTITFTNMHPIVWFKFILGVLQESLEHYFIYFLLLADCLFLLSSYSIFFPAEQAASLFQYCIDRVKKCKNKGLQFLSYPFACCSEVPAENDFVKLPLLLKVRKNMQKFEER